MQTKNRSEVKRSEAVMRNEMYSAGFHQSSSSETMLHYSEKPRQEAPQNDKKWLYWLQVMDESRHLKKELRSKLPLLSQMSNWSLVFPVR